MAISIIESSGCFVVIDWSQMPGRKSQRTSAVLAVAGAPAEDLVRDGRDDRDEQHPPEDGDPQLRAGEQAEEQDADDDEDDEELGAAARMRRRVRTHVRHRQRLVVLERMDGHVLGAVVLEDPADLG